jgi:proline iminopeptidase
MEDAGGGQPAPPRRSGDFDVVSDRVTLKVHARGPSTGSNVILVHHGGPGLAHQMVLDLARFVPRNWTFVTYDQRGAGESTWTEDAGRTQSDYGLAAYVADVEAIRAALGVEKLHLFGHS